MTIAFQKDIFSLLVLESSDREGNILRHLQAEC